MFLKKAIRKNQEEAIEQLRDDLDKITKRVDTLEASIEKLKEDTARGTYVNEDGERVPMTQVLNEYLYGKEEKA